MTIAQHAIALDTVTQATRFHARLLNACLRADLDDVPSDPEALHIAIIGAGAAGLSVAAISAALGFRVTLIERGEMGGDCLNTGCVPSKALLAVAHLAAAQFKLLCLT